MQKNNAQASLDFSMKTKIPKCDLFGTKKVQNGPMRGQNMKLISDLYV